MKTIKQNVMTAIILVVSFLWFGCEDDQPQSRVEVETFKVEVLNDTVPSEVHVIIKSKSFGSVELIYTHERAYYSLDEIEQRNTTTSYRVSDRDIEINDTLVLFYKDAGTHNISLNALGKEFEDDIELFE